METKEKANAPSWVVLGGKVNLTISPPRGAGYLPRELIVCEAVVTNIGKRTITVLLVDAAAHNPFANKKILVPVVGSLIQKVDSTMWRSDWSFYVNPYDTDKIKENEQSVSERKYVAETIKKVRDLVNSDYYSTDIKRKHLIELRKQLMDILPIDEK